MGQTNGVLWYCSGCSDVYLGTTYCASESEAVTCHNLDTRFDSYVCQETTNPIQSDVKLRREQDSPAEGETKSTGHSHHIWYILGGMCLVVAIIFAFAYSRMKS